ncbi:MAG: amidase [Alphaproteobacteria bacterium]|nr:amidase [Alphaproteobacteria bacterium]
MTHKDYTAHDAVGLAGLIARKDVSAAELLDTAIARMEAVNPSINAVVLQHRDLARKAIADGLPRGPFAGVPFLLKDLNAALKGTVTTQGSRFFKDAVADHDSTLVERYKRAGLVIFGKTSSPEFGATCSTEPTLFGPCRNPWNLGHTPGGSSGGAAAAVAAGIVPAAHASDGGGSIRIPASACGLFGMKPTRGRTPSGPKRGEGWAGLSIAHVVSHSVRDSAALLDATDGPASGDPYAAPPKLRPYAEELNEKPGRLRIALNVTAQNGAAVDPECRAAAEGAARLLESLGHHVEEARPAIDAAALRQAQATIVSISTAAAFKERAMELGREPRPDEMEHINALTAEIGNKTSGVDYLMAIGAVHRAGRVVGEFFESFDVLLTPTMGCVPMAVGRLSLARTDIAGWLEDLGSAIAFTTLANQTGCPAMSLPLAMSQSGLPIGVMGMAACGREDMLFRLAAQVEEAAPWKDRRPAL